MFENLGLLPTGGADPLQPRWERIGPDSLTGLLRALTERTIYDSAENTAQNRSNPEEP